MNREKLHDRAAKARTIIDSWIDSLLSFYLKAVDKHANKKSVATQTTALEVYSTQKIVKRDF